MVQRCKNRGLSHGKGECNNPLLTSTEKKKKQSKKEEKEGEALVELLSTFDILTNTGAM